MFSKLEMNFLAEPQVAPLAVMTLRSCTVLEKYFLAQTGDFHSQFVLAVIERVTQIHTRTFLMYTPLKSIVILAAMKIAALDLET